MNRIKEIAQSMLDCRLWDEDEINRLRDLCAEAKISSDFGAIFDAYEGRADEDSADGELKAIVEAMDYVVTEINNEINDADTRLVVIPSALLDDEHFLDADIELSDESPDSRWWKHVEGNGSDIGVYTDSQNQYWILVHSSGRFELRFVGEVSDVLEAFGINEAVEEND